MALLKRNILLLAFAILIVACNKQVSDAVDDLPRINVPQFGEENTLEIASWNIEQFPKHNATVSDVKEIILDLDVDIYAVQEINSAYEFQNLIDSLNISLGGIFFDGRLNEKSSSLKTGIVFKKSLVQVLDSTYLFVGDNDFAGRPPYALYLRAQKNNRVFDFTLIVVHLKAFGDPESQARRQRAIQKLKSYIQNRLQQSGNDPDYIIAGDWNDELEDPPQNNVFLPFLDDPANYRFLTEPFAGSSTEYSYIGGSFRSLIDHIMITASIDSSYTIITPKIIKIDEFFNLYDNEVSDHRPVAARFPAF
jgi:endonuclease/exonuclease/phosphatase family metal-dependent hydrolase